MPEPNQIEHARIMGISLDTEPGPHGGTIEEIDPLTAARDKVDRLAAEIDAMEGISVWDESNDGAQLRGKISARIDAENEAKRLEAGRLDAFEQAEYEERIAPGAPVETRGRTPITRSTDGSLIPLDPQRRHPKDRPVRLTVAQRAWAGDRRAETADEITGGLGVSWVDLQGYDPDGNPVTLRTAAVAYVEIFAEGRKSFHGPIVALSMLSPVNLVYVDRDGQQLTTGSLDPADPNVRYVKIGWPTVVEDGGASDRELTPEQEDQLRQDDYGIPPAPADKVGDLMTSLEQSVANAKAARARAREAKPLPGEIDHPNAPADLDPLEGIRITTAEIDAAGYAKGGIIPKPGLFTVNEDAGPQGETLVDPPSDG